MTEEDKAYSCTKQTSVDENFKPLAVFTTSTNKIKAKNKKNTSGQQQKITDNRIPETVEVLDPFREFFGSQTREKTPRLLRTKIRFYMSRATNHDFDLLCLFIL